MDTVQLIDVLARAMCNDDEQRHRPMHLRNGRPCRLHTNLAWPAAEALLKYYNVTKKD